MLSAPEVVHVAATVLAEVVVVHLLGELGVIVVASGVAVVGTDDGEADTHD